MIANKSYAYDLSVPEFIPDRYPSKKDFKILKNPKKDTIKKIKEVSKEKIKPKSKLSLVVSLGIVFTLCILMSLRYNIISEKNLELQRLRTEQTKINSELATTEIQVDKVIDKDKVESYAKQQLGMQKPEKNQMIYISTDSGISVNEISNQNIFEQGLNKLKNLIGIK